MTMTDSSKASELYQSTALVLLLLLLLLATHVCGLAHVHALGAWAVKLAHLQQQLARGGELEHLLPARVGHPHVVGAVHGDHVRHEEVASAPVPQHSACSGRQQQLLRLDGCEPQLALPFWG
jgi:hypothetical protein